MNEDHVVRKTIRIEAEIDKVWDALTNPEITKKYFFNCEAISDWKVGSRLDFQTRVEGEDTVVVTGIITAIEPNSVLEHTCYIPEFENDPSKHTDVTYKFESENGSTVISVSQGPFEDEEKRNHTNFSWDTVLSGLKKVLEEG